MVANFIEKLNDLKKQNTYRALENIDFIDDVIVKHKNKSLISFASNDYFSLANDSRVQKAAINAINKYGVGSRSSRYICGNNSLYQKLEKLLAKIHGCDDAIIFSSGYAAAIGAIPALVGEGDLVVADKLIHSCLLDGVKLSGAKLIRFAHNDIKHAREVIQNNIKYYQKILIITEEIFSMDGDLGEVAKLEKLVQEFDCLFLVDGAHSLFAGVGKKGRTRCAPTIIKFGTLSKAVGALGGYVAADAITIDYLRNFAKSAIYTTALPPAILAAAHESLKIIAQKNLAKKLLENVHYFCDLMNLPRAQSAIVIIKIGDNKKVLAIKNSLIERGFLISAIRPPTVDSKGARLRISFCVKHTKKQIGDLARNLKSFS